MYCFACSEKRTAIRFRKIGYNQNPGLPICHECDALSDNELSKKLAKYERKKAKK